MPEAFVRLVCPACEEHWERSPSDLPAPNEPFTCTSCDAERPMSEFMRTARDLEIREQFHE